MKYTYIAASFLLPWTAVVAYNACGGYSVTSNTIHADLDIIGTGCASYGPDVLHLKLIVEYQSRSRLHIVIRDRDATRYTVPEDIIPRPGLSTSATEQDSKLTFTYTKSPFALRVARASIGEVLFDTSENNLIFQPQFLRLKTGLPRDPNIYGLGEHIDSFRLSNDDYIRTLHPVYFEYRSTGTHVVFLLNSNGMDIKLRRESSEKSSMEFIAIGGVLDLYFLAGPTPVEVSRQYAEVVGTPAMVPYWSLGFHQCKFGYQDWFQVAEVIANYSAAGIPLETMWTDIDYLDHRRVFSLDSHRFPLAKMRDIVHHLHDHQQQYILMVDPAVAKWDYPAYNQGREPDVFLKAENGEYFEGVVWPGVAVFPDWYHPNASTYWLQQIRQSFRPDTGIDIDGVWIDMNEPASMCRFPCRDPPGEAEMLGMPPEPPPLRDPPRQLPGFGGHGTKADANPKNQKWDYGAARFPISGNENQQRLHGRGMHHTEEDLISPPYRIHNGGPSGNLSDLTVHTDLVHANGMLEYDLHNLYGTMMGMVTRHAMLQRRRGLKPFIVTRSSFAGSGKYVQKWLGYNASRWDHYRSSIAGLLAFASVFQMPMVGSDVCGFKLTPSDKLCARWTTLGAFAPFFRNHAHDEAPPQEFYLWPLVAKAAKYAISVRYRLLDYLYTALQQQSIDGTPAINPLWYIYPNDSNTYGLDLQYFYGNCLLVSPVTEENATDVRIYLPDDIFYNFETGEPVRGHGDFVYIKDVPFDRIPLHVRGGCVVPLRVESANTTTELRKKSFELLVAPGLCEGSAKGALYLDDGISLNGGENPLWLTFRFADGLIHTSAVTSTQPSERRVGKLNASWQHWG
ncbi:alpha-glucosidase [Coniochaeta sp. 2T2.1]|nr:alpha-glucosidase [Coniochaeta sp. 2T2.1]